MYVLFIISCIFASSLIVQGFPSEISADDLDTKILGGRVAENGEYPHQVSLQWIYSPGFNMKFCGGSILSPTWILTAAHCVDVTENRTDLYVKAGVVKALANTTTSQLIRVKNTFKHPQYAGAIWPHDIALLELEKELAYNKNIQPIALPPADYIPTGEGDIIGWGGTGPRMVDENPPDLRTVHVNVTPIADCNREIFGVTKDHVCPGNKTHSACFGDSGGPFVQTLNGVPTVVGVASFIKKPCGTAPPVYARVSSYVDNFIKTTRNL